MSEFFPEFWHAAWPLCRLLLGMSCGLLLANLLEALRWTNQLAKMAKPLAAFAHLGSVASSAFTLAFISPAAANGLLSEANAKCRLSNSELMLANLFNSFPAWLAHMPTVFLLTWPAIGSAAIIYSGLTLAAAVFRTAFTIIMGRMLLPAPKMAMAQEVAQPAPLLKRLNEAMGKAWKRFKKRLPKLLLFTAPVYLLMYFGQQSGFFASMETWMAAHLGWLAFLKPQAMGVIMLQLVAEMGAALGAAGAALADGSLSSRDIVVAMLVGNVLATPLRAIRHQLPSYAGFYSFATALKLVLANQGLRAASMLIITILYVLW